MEREGGRLGRRVDEFFCKPLDGKNAWPLINERIMKVPELLRKRACVKPDSTLDRETHVTPFIPVTAGLRTNPKARGRCYSYVPSECSLYEDEDPVLVKRYAGSALFSTVCILN